MHWAPSLTTGQVPSTEFLAPVTFSRRKKKKKKKKKQVPSLRRTCSAAGATAYVPGGHGCYPLLRSDRAQLTVPCCMPSRVWCRLSLPRYGYQPRIAPAVPYCRAGTTWGWVSVVDLLLVFYPVSRSSFLHWITGTDFPKLIRYHRSAAMPACLLPG